MSRRTPVPCSSRRSPTSSGSARRSSRLPDIRLAEVTSNAELGAVPNEFKESLNRYLATEAGPGLPVRTLSDIVAYANAHPERYPYGHDLLDASDATPGSAEVSTVLATPVTASTAGVLEATFAAHDLDAIVGPGDYYSYHGAASGWASLTVPAGMIGNVPEGSCSSDGLSPRTSCSRTPRPTSGSAAHGFRRRPRSTAHSSPRPARQ